MSMKANNLGCINSMAKMIVKSIASKITDEWLLTKHYAKRKCNRMFCYGLFIENKLCGIVTYGQPSSPQVGRGFLGEDYRTRVLELNRLCVNETAPKNSASCLIGRSLKMMPKGAVVSYADGMMGHVGYIYQATNFIYVGSAKSHDNEYCVDGKWTHAKSLADKGITAPSKWAKENNIEIRKPQAKHRYIYFTDKKLKKHLKYTALPYPKGVTNRYNCVDIVSQPPRQSDLFL